MKNDNIHTELYEFTEEILASKNQVKLKVEGYSMFPILRPGDDVVIQRCNISDLSAGDIIGFKNKKNWIAHRLLQTIKKGDTTSFISKGDTCNHYDPLFSEEQFIGKIISCNRNSKEKDLENDFYKNMGFLIARFPMMFTTFFRLILWINRKISSIITFIKDTFTRLQFISKTSKRLLRINIMLSICQGILPFLLIYFIKWLIDTISSSYIHPENTDAFNSLMVIITATGLIFLTQSIVNSLSTLYRERLSYSITKHIYNQLHQKHTQLDMAHIEDANQQDTIHRATQEATYRPVKMISETLTLMQALVSCIIILTILFSINNIISLLIIIAVIPEMAFRFWFSSNLYKQHKASSPDQRKATYYNRLLTGLPFTKEIRLFDLGSYFTSTFTSLQDKLHYEKESLLIKRTKAFIIAQVFSTIIIFTSFGFITYFAMQGAISLGTVVLFFLVFLRGFSVMKELFQSIAGLFEDNVFITDFFDFIHLPNHTNNTKQNTTFAPITKGIFIDNISFHYPSSQRNALNNVTLEIPVGKTIALVGANGSGKTSLIKLLCGFYTPDKGEILFDDTNITTVDPKEIRKQITAVFQDFALYNMPAGENIYLGNTASPMDKLKIKEAAENAGIDDILSHLPFGYENIIGNLIEKGEELSIGQWQKMAIARAFYRNAPILFMDEPSSALDAKTEQELISNIKKLTKDKTVLIVSHRFSTIKWADMIYVMDKGSIVEYGNHEQLLEKESLYYELFNSAKGE